MKDFNEYLKQNKDFIQSFSISKFNDICYHISKFYQYLSLPRDGFKKVENPDYIYLGLVRKKCIAILNEKEKSIRKIPIESFSRCENNTLENSLFCQSHRDNDIEKQNIDFLIQTKKISTKMVMYIFNELYNCKNFTPVYSDKTLKPNEQKNMQSITNYLESLKFDINYEVLKNMPKDIEEEKVLENIKNINLQLQEKKDNIDLINQKIKYEEKLSEINYKNNIKIDHQIKNIVIKYIATCVYNIIYIESEYTDLRTKFIEIQKYVLENKRDYNDFNLENEWSNITFQAFLYIIVALTDWLEINDITEIEIDTAIEFILLEFYRNTFRQNFIKNNTILNNKLSQETDFREKFEKMKGFISLAFKNYNLNIKLHSCEYLLRNIFTLINLDELRKL